MAEENFSKGCLELDDQNDRPLFKDAEHHCKQAVLYAKKLKKGDEKMQRVYDTLQLLATIYFARGETPEGKAVYEERYNYLVEVYDPEHPLVLKAAGKLIEILNLSEVGDYYNAERFAKVCYEALTRPPLDPESYEAAKAALNLARASYNLYQTVGPDSADIEEAEMLAKEGVSYIMNNFKGCVSDIMIDGVSDIMIDDVSNIMMDGVCTLLNIKFMKKDFGDETRNLLEDYFSHAMKYDGDDTNDHIALANMCLAQFHYKICNTISSIDAIREHLLLSESHFKEKLRIEMIELNTNHPTCVQVTLELNDVYVALEQISSY
jgi:hypothetical protein